MMMRFVNEPGYPVVNRLLAVMWTTKISRTKGKFKLIPKGLSSLFKSLKFKLSFDKDISERQISFLIKQCHN